MIHIYTKMNF